MKVLPVLLLVISETSLSQNLSPLSLEAAIKIGRENNRSLKMSAAMARAAEARSGAAAASLLPSLTVDGSYRRLSDVPAFAIQPPGFPKPFVVSPTVLDNTTARVSLQQPVFTGFRLRSNACSAEELAGAAEMEDRNETQDVDLAITDAYWSLYQLQENLKATDENVGRLESFERDSQNLLNAGMATRNDLLRIEVQLNSARLQQIDAANDVQVAMMTLNMMMGRPLETGIRLASEPSLPTAENTGAPGLSGRPLAELIAGALQQRNDLIAMTHRVEASRAGVTAAQGSWWPQLVLSANYYAANPNTRYQPVLPGYKETWDVGVSLQMDIWNWGHTGYETDQARAMLLQSETQLEQLKEDIAFNVRRQSLAVHRSIRKVGVAAAGVDQAEENLRTIGDKFKHGLATSSDLLDADVALLQARTSLTVALVERELATARLARAVGSPSTGGQ